MADEPKQVDRLDGGLVTLEPLRPNHAAALFPSVADPEVWRWKLVDQPRSVEELRDLIDGVLTGRRRWSFVIRRRLDGAPIGSTTLGHFDWPHRCVENGFTWLDRTSWGQGYNEDTKRLLLTHLFDDLDFARVEWQCDTRNERSAAALARLGFTHEGTLRSRHARPDGTRRDSLVFGLIRADWPAVRTRIEQLIAERAARPTGPQNQVRTSPTTP